MLAVLSPTGVPVEVEPVEVAGLGGRSRGLGPIRPYLRACDLRVYSATRGFTDSKL